MWSVLQVLVVLGLRLEEVGIHGIGRTCMEGRGSVHHSGVDSDARPDPTYLYCRASAEPVAGDARTWPGEGFVPRRGMLKRCRL